MTELSTQIVKSVRKLPARRMREVMNFINYLESKEDASFIEYVNERTRKAVQSKKQGEHFTTLKELQAEYKYDVPKGNSFRLSYNFTSGQVFTFCAVGNWDSPKGAKNNFNFKVSVYEYKG